jgi:hypothetical protein
MSPDVDLKTQSSNVKPFPPVTKQEALAIAGKRCNTEGGEFECFHTRPERCFPYLSRPEPHCWYVYAPWNESFVGLRSRRVIVISRVNGAVLYDGEAGDEG